MTTRKETLDLMLLSNDGEAMYPVTLDLRGAGGNVFAIVGTCEMILRAAQIDRQTIMEFREECLAGDYTHALDTVDRYFKATWIPGRETRS